MGNKVKTETLIDAWELINEEELALLDKRTDKVVFVSSEDLCAAEYGESYEHLEDWVRKSREIAIDFLVNEQYYAELPRKDDWSEYDVMQEFCYSISDPIVKAALLKSIRGKGAFRRFEENLLAYNLEQIWYSYKDKNLKEFIEEWAKEAGIELID